MMIDRAKINFEFKLTGGLESVVQIGKDATKVFAHVIPEDEVFGFKTVLMEMINNAVIHGNKKDLELDVQGSVSYSVSKGEMAIVISDHGEGFNWIEVTNDINTEPEDEEVLKESGRGFLMVRMYGYKYRFNELGNRVKLTKRFKK